MPLQRCIMPAFIPILCLERESVQRILGYMRKAIQEFDLISDGDRIAVGVFYAAIIRVSYDLVTDCTGTTQHFDYYIADQDTAAAACYTMLASIGIPTYVESAGQNTAAAYADLSEYQTQLEEGPAAVLTPSC